MKRIALILLVMTILFAATACSSNTPSQQTESRSSQESVPDSYGETTASITSEADETTQPENTNGLDNMEIKEIPAEYKTGADHAGSVVRFDYKTSAEDKYALVYLPCGYTSAEKYDIFYYMHGGGGSQSSLFSGAGSSNDIKNALDHLIENGEMKPVIIVAPTFYTNKNGDSSVSGSWDAVREFPSELTDYLMPAVESAYSTYAESADDAGFAASRNHRAFGGFSMGSVTTWYVFSQNMKYFGTFIPISGDSWAAGMQGGRSDPEKTAKLLSDAVIAQEFTANDFMIYAITGSEDIAEPCMTPMFDSMEAYEDVFRMNENSNTYYFVKEGASHSMPYVKEYLYNLLPVIYGGTEKWTRTK